MSNTSTSSANHRLKMLSKVYSNLLSSQVIMRIWQNRLKSLNRPLKAPWQRLLQNYLRIRVSPMQLRGGEFEVASPVIKITENPDRRDPWRCFRIKVSTVLRNVTVAVLLSTKFAMKTPSMSQWHRPFQRFKSVLTRSWQKKSSASSDKNRCRKRRADL